MEEIEMRVVPLTRPSIGQEEIDGVVEVMKSGWLTTGKRVKQFEKNFAEEIGCSEAVAVNSCTGGLHVVLKAMGIGPGDEVIVPTMTFCATANVVVHVGAEPVLVDCQNDLCIDPRRIEEAIGPKTKAMIVVHHSGRMCDMVEIMRLSKEHGIPVIEDAAHAVMAGCSVYGDDLLDRCGSDRLATLEGGQSIATVFSFYAIKNLTTGEGGMIALHGDEEFAQRVRRLVLHGMSKDAWKRYDHVQRGESAGSWYYEVDEPGFKYNMMDLQAAIGLEQLKKIGSMNVMRRTLSTQYDRCFSFREQFVSMEECLEKREDVYGEWARYVSSAHLYVLRLVTEKCAVTRNEMIEGLAKVGIGTSVHFIPLHRQPYYRDRYGLAPKDFPVANGHYEKMLSLPLFPDMTSDDLDYVCGHVIALASKGR